MVVMEGLGIWWRRGVGLEGRSQAKEGRMW